MPVVALGGVTLVIVIAGRAVRRIDVDLHLARVFSAHGAVRRQRRRADLLSSRVCRARSRPRWSAARSRRRASCFRGCCAIRWRRRTRSACRPARRSARWSRSRSARRWPVGGVATASLAGALLAVAVVYALAQRAASRAFDDGAAARGRHAQRVFLGADPVRAVPQRLRADVSRAALADGRSRRRELRADSRRAAVRRRRVSPRSRGWRGRSICSASARRPPARAASTSCVAQRVAFFSASLATGAAVSVGGPIGFVGIIVPHLVRLVVGADHRLVLPASTLFRRARFSSRATCSPAPRSRRSSCPSASSRRSSADRSFCGCS